ncbi:hypothetical protein BDZ89DRAFT_1137866 [Hymenopellis radicata]|nr:hypothetical protein BDZ89DRAFT_1137866 [Hymenopellis radicata]
MRTDARFILIEKDGKGIDSKHVPTSAVAAPAEFKTRLTAKLCVDSESKALRAIGHVFYADPCRRSVMAFTIEDHMMRFWHRRIARVFPPTTILQFVSESRALHSFVIFMAFASLEDLGCVPTERIHISEDLEEIQYRFTAGVKVYQTIGVIHEMNLEIVTRATRVWEVVELGPADVPIGGSKVLKDVWLYFDAKPESDMYNEFFHTEKRIRSRRGLPSMRADRAAYPHKKRMHRRIVFEEVCRTLYKASSYANFTKGLAQLAACSWRLHRWDRVIQVELRFDISIEVLSGDVHGSLKL